MPLKTFQASISMSFVSELDRKDVIRNLTSSWAPLADIHSFRRIFSTTSRSKPSSTGYFKCLPQFELDAVSASTIRVSELGARRGFKQFRSLVEFQLIFFQLLSSSDELVMLCGPQHKIEIMPYKSTSNADFIELIIF